MRSVSVLSEWKINMPRIIEGGGVEVDVGRALGQREDFNFFGLIVHAGHHAHDGV